MKKPVFFLIFVFTIFISLVSKAESIQDFHSQRIIIKFKPDNQLLLKIRSIVPESLSESFEVKTTENFSLNKFFSDFNIRSIKALKPGEINFSLPGGIERIFIAEIENPLLLNEIIASLNSQSFIEYAEKDFIGNGYGVKVDNQFLEKNNSGIIPNDPLFNQQWSLRNTGQVVNGVTGVAGADINITGGWDITTGSSSVKLAILDSGIPLAASEFSGRILPGYDFANNDDDPTDDQGHGTNVTSIAAAKGNNSSLITGVNWNCKIIPIKILNSNNSGFYSWWISGITMAADSGAKVLNMSVGGNSFSEGLQDAITYANSFGAVVVACMMNNNNSVPYYPAAFNNVIAIGAINNQNRRAVPFCWGGGSSFGSHIDFCSPGEMILGLDAFNTDQTNYWCGTSQATPMVSGLISLMFSINPALTFNQIYTKIKDNAVDRIGPPNEDSLGFDSYFGWGRINAEATLKSVIVSVANYSSSIPNNFSLYQNYPNPFNPNTVISYQLTVSSYIKLKVYDVLGNLIETLVNEKQNAGTYSINWDAANFPSGIYYYTFSTGNFLETKKMTVLK